MESPDEIEEPEEDLPVDEFSIDDQQEALERASKSAIEAAVARASKNAMKVKFSGDSRSPARSTGFKPTQPPCRFSFPPSMAGGMAELLSAQVDGKTRVMRNEVRYRAALKLQVGESTKRVREASLGKSLESMVKEHSNAMQHDRRQRKKGLKFFSPMAPLHTVQYPAQARPTPRPGVPEQDAGAGADGKSDQLGRKASEVMQEMAKMQVSASEWFRAELHRQSSSCPDLRVASDAVRERQRMEGRGLQDVMDSTVKRVLGMRSEEAEAVDAAPADTSKAGGPLDDTGAIYVDKVERWHRSLVWGQQFDFFDRHIAAVVDQDEIAAQLEGHELPERSARVLPPTVLRRKQRKLKPIPAAPLMTSNQRTATWTTTFVQKGAHPHGVPPPRKSLADTAKEKLAMSQTLPACWRMGASVSTPSFFSGTGATGGPAMSARAGALDDWAEGYYGEDVRGPSVLEHEDVMHTVNPELFPLKALPLRSPTPLTPLATPSALAWAASSALSAPLSPAMEYPESFAETLSP